MPEKGALARSSTRHGERQAAGAVLMVRPRSFFSNPQTARTNQLQGLGPAADSTDELPSAMREFDAVVGRLQGAGIDVVAADAPPQPAPDAIFPNNWLSTHADGTVVLYPMHATNRRAERQPEITGLLERTLGVEVRRVVDLSHLEATGCILEGTGSMVLDRQHRVAYASLSARTTLPALQAFCSALRYRECAFTATHPSGASIYHTNVMLSIGTRLVIGCFDAIANPEQRIRVLEQLEAGGRTILPLTQAQLHEYGANVLELCGSQGPVLAISARAWAALDNRQRRTIEALLAPVVVDVGVIERVGGGGIRCMLAEVHLPRRQLVSRQSRDLESEVVA